MFMGRMLLFAPTHSRGSSYQPWVVSMTAIDRISTCGTAKREALAERGLMPEGAESYAKPFSATCIRQ